MLSPAECFASLLLKSIYTHFSALTSRRISPNISTIRSLIYCIVVQTKRGLESETMNTRSSAYAPILNRKLKRIHMISSTSTFHRNGDRTHPCGQTRHTSLDLRSLPFLKTAFLFLR